MKKINYAARVRSVLKKTGRYSGGMTMLIESTATSLATIDMCRRELETLETTSIIERTRYGERLVPHPVFKTLRDAQNVLLKNCKGLGLSYSELSKIVDGENDPLNDLIRAMEDDG